jgi:cytochrome P450
MHFGLGGRQCIGKTMALTNIYKVVATLLKEFDFQLAEEAEEGYEGPQMPPLISVGVSDLDGPLLVTAKARNA